MAVAANPGRTLTASAHWCGEEAADTRPGQGEPSAVATASAAATRKSDLGLAFDRRDGAPCVRVATELQQRPRFDDRIAVVARAQRLVELHQPCVLRGRFRHACKRLLEALLVFVVGAGGGQTRHHVCGSAGAGPYLERQASDVLTLGAERHTLDVGQQRGQLGGGRVRDVQHAVAQEVLR